nr:hypothetical protein [Haladaptatus halobius]
MKAVSRLHVVEVVFEPSANVLGVDLRSFVGRISPFVRIVSRR